MLESTAVLSAPSTLHEGLHDGRMHGTHEQEAKAGLTAACYIRGLKNIPAKNKARLSHIAMASAILNLLSTRNVSLYVEIRM